MNYIWLIYKSVCNYCLCFVDVDVDHWRNMMMYEMIDGGSVNSLSTKQKTNRCPLRNLKQLPLFLSPVGFK